MNDERMNWKNLRRNKCAKCGGELVSHASTMRLVCKNTQCNWAISHEAFQRVVGDMNKEATDRPTYQDDDREEDLRKSEPCSFCHTRHGPRDRCAGFGTE